MLKGYRTTIFAALLVMFGALQAALPDLRAQIPADAYPYILIAVGAIVQTLRNFTSTSIFTKEGEPPKTLHEAIVQAVAAIVVIANIAIALSPSPAKAATRHADGSFTLSREEADEVLKALAAGEMALHELVKLSRAKGCT